MNITKIFIEKPVMTTLVMFGILLFGFAGYRSLPVSDLPNIDFPTIQVSAGLPGANPETMASSVATPLEKQLSTIAGIDTMSSVSSSGSTQITLQFNLSRSIDAAAQDVQSAIAAAGRQLPPGMPTPPTFRKVNPADQPIIYLALSSETLPLSKVDEYGETMMAQRISTINGVAQVQVFGAQKYAVRVQLDPNALASRGVGITDVEQAIQRGNVNMPTGTLSGEHQTYTVESSGQLTTAADYRPLVVTYRNGAPIRLGELGNVIDSVENNKTASWFNSTRAIILAVQRQPGTNTVEVVDQIKKLLPKFQAQLPASVHLDILFDRAAPIEASVEDVKFTLLLTIGLVIAVIFLFLRTVTATIIPSLAVPMSIIGTFAAMYLLGYNLDNLSLMALTLSVGFVVDDAIVMLENIVRHIEHGEDKYTAALNGSKEIGFTIISMTLSLAAVFIPVLFLGGILGRLLNEFAMTITIAILISGFISLSLTPMLCRLFLRDHDAEKAKKTGRFYQLSERFFDRMLALYEWSLKIVLRHRFATLIASFLILFATIGLFMLVPKGFIPSDDLGYITGSTEGAQNISFDEMMRHQQTVAQIIKENPNVDALMSSVGGGGGGGYNSGRVIARLKPLSVRKATPEQVIEQLRKAVSVVPGIRIYLQNPPTIPVGGRVSKSQYQYTLQGYDKDELFHFAPILESKLRELPGLQDVTTDLQLESPQVIVKIDRDKASALGVTANQIETSLADAYGSKQVTSIYTDTNEYAVIMEVKPEYQLDPSMLSTLYISTGAANTNRSASGGQTAATASTPSVNNGASIGGASIGGTSSAANNGGAQMIPLSTVAELSNGVSALSISHLGQLPAVTISFNLKPGVSIGDAVNQIQTLAQNQLPATITGSFQGTAQAFQSSLQNLGILLIVAILVIYMVLGILYESFIHPITILSGLPSAGFGALLTLLLFRVELSIYAFVGIIMLIGIVKKNAIMMIDFALEAERNEGKSAAESIYQGCIVRFRPIMMTTMAALMGTLPIALGFGAGASSRRPLGLAVVGGLLFSQLITLYITPVIYIYLDSLQDKLRHRFQKAGPSRDEHLPVTE